MGKKLTNSLIYTLLTGIIGWMLYTGKMAYYLHPRMMIYIFIAMIGFFVLALYGWYHVYHAYQHNQRISFQVSIGHIPFLLLFTLIALNPSKITADVLENKGVDLTVPTEQYATTLAEDVNEDTLSDTGDDIDGDINDGVNTDVIEDNEGTNEAGEEIINNPDDSVSQTKDQPDIDPVEESAETTDVNTEEVMEPSEENDPFMETLIALNERTDDYIGKSIAIDGFVYREDFYQENNLVVGRLLISCCAADASVVGLFVDSDEAPNFEKDTWIRVEGSVTIEQMETPYDDEKYEIFMIKDAAIKAIEPYSTSYVYY